MNFRRGMAQEEPEINFIPLIDVLLVILIFLMVTTSFSKFTELQVNLPSASAEGQPERSNELLIGVGNDGQYVVGQTTLSYKDPISFARDLKTLAKDLNNPIVIIHADAGATHQAVVNVLEAARLAGLGRVTFATQSNK
jgi:biopolymer transport protein ExbD